MQQQRFQLSMHVLLLFCVSSSRNQIEMNKYLDDAGEVEEPLEAEKPSLIQ